MPPPSVLKRKPGVSAGDDNTSAKRVNSEEDFEQMFSSTSSEASSSSRGSPTRCFSSTSSDMKTDVTPTGVPVSIWDLLQEHKVSGCYLPPTDMWPKK